MIEMFRVRMAAPGQETLPSRPTIEDEARGYSVAEVGSRIASVGCIPLSICGRPLSGKGKTLGSLLRVVGCCHLSGLRCGRNTAAGLYGSSRTGSRSPEACSKHSGKPWLSRPRLADCCAILSFRSPSRPRDRGQPNDGSAADGHEPGYGDLALADGLRGSAASPSSPPHDLTIITTPRSRGNEGSQTRRWSKPDSNLWSHFQRGQRFRHSVSRSTAPAASVLISENDDFAFPAAKVTSLAKARASC